MKRRLENRRLEKRRLEKRRLEKRRLEKRRLGKRRLERRGLMLPWGLLCVALVLGACAKEVPFRTSFDSSAGSASCEILGDGFVRTGDRRIPLEAFVLELRQATRALSKKERLRYTVAWRITPNLSDEAAAQVAADGNNYLILQLQIMGVRQAGL